MKYILTFFLTIFLLPPPTIADTIILKNGRQIQTDKIWEKDGIVRYNMYGVVVGHSREDVAKIIRSKQPKPVQFKNGFKFDIWHSGMTIPQMMAAAEKHDIPLHRAGLISANKRFDPKMCRPYAHTATKFEYKIQMLGRHAKVALAFTPVSKRLYSIMVSWSGSGISPKSEFRNQVEAMLIEKYGRPVKTENKIIFKTFDFKINPSSIVTMRPGGNYVQLLYLDKRLSRLAEDEETANVRNGFTGSDKGKF